MKRDCPRVEVGSREELRVWLAAHHEQQESIWLVIAKKTAGERYIPYEAIVEEALCFGWIDSLVHALDDTRTMRLLSPRRPKSVWSAINRERVGRLIETGRMHPAGLAKVEAAKADGSWTRAEPMGADVLPDALAARLRNDPATRALFDALPPGKRRLAITWVTAARTDATRVRRIDALVVGLERGLDPIEWRAGLVP